MRPEFSIIMLYHQQLDMTEECVKNVLASIDKDFELIVVCNDVAGKEVRQVDDSRVTYTTMGYNTGFVDGNMFAFEHLVQGKYTILLNNDTVFSKDWLSVIRDGFENDPLVRIVGPIGCIFNDQGVGRKTEDPNPSYIEGCCLAILTDFVREELNGELFHPDMEFAYCEDSELNLRVQKMGYKVKKVDFYFKHLHAQTSSLIKKENTVDIAGYHAKNHHTLRRLHYNFFKHGSFAQNVYLKRRAAIGDVFFLSPFIEEIKRLNKYAIITVITDCPQLLVKNPHISEVIPHHLWYKSCEELPDGSVLMDFDGAYEGLIHQAYMKSYEQVARINLHGNYNLIHYMSAETNLWAKNEFGDRKYVVFHMGPTGWPGRDLPMATTYKVIDFVRSVGYGVIEVGYHNHLHEVEHYQVDMNKTAAIIKFSKAFVGTDSSPSHIAQSYNIPGVVVMGCTRFKFVYPQKNGKLQGVIAGDVKCRYCHHWQEPNREFCECVRGTPECMNKIRPQQIIERLKQWLL